MATKERLIIESLFMIADKEGNDMPFILNPAQAKIDSYLTGRDIIPKARQEGVSSYYLARNLAKCLSKRNTRAVVISHETEATQRMLGKVHYMLEHLRGPKARIQNSSKNEITFPKTNSMFYIGTAGSRKFGRGDTITDLHCSEVAFWDDPKSLLTGLFQAVPISGEISIESTGNGVGNWYHRAVMQADSGDIMPGMKRSFRLHFLDWASFPEYRNKLTDKEKQEVLDSLLVDLEEPELLEYGLDAEQLAFRRDKLAELDWDLSSFKQEYPLTLDECFQSASRSIFQNIKYKKSQKWVRVDANTHALKGHPDERYTYMVAADVAGGVGGNSNFENTKRTNEGDRSIAHVFCLETGEQVYEYASNSVSPSRFGQHIVYTARYYNHAYVSVESNNHGISTLDKIKDMKYPLNLIYTTNRRSKSGDEAEGLNSLGVRTTTKSKPMMVSELREAIQDWMTIYSPALRDEMSTFVEHENGKLAAQEGCFDDRVMAAAIAAYTWDRSLLHTRKREKKVDPALSPFTLEAMLAELRREKSDLPIPSYLSIGDSNEDSYNLEDWGWSGYWTDTIQ